MLTLVLCLLALLAASLVAFAWYRRRHATPLSSRQSWYRIKGQYPRIDLKHEADVRHPLPSRPEV